MSRPSIRPFWVSWYGTGKEFELHSPWWISGWRDDQPTICAAVRAIDELSAKAQIIDAHDEVLDKLPEWRFVEERPEDWSPFSGRFPRADWMQW